MMSCEYMISGLMAGRDTLLSSWPTSLASGNAFSACLYFQRIHHLALTCCAATLQWSSCNMVGSFQCATVVCRLYNRTCYGAHVVTSLYPLAWSPQFSLL